MDSRGEETKLPTAKKPKTTHSRLTVQQSNPQANYTHLLHYVLNQTMEKPRGEVPTLETTWTEMEGVMQDLLDSTRRESKTEELPIPTVEDLERPSIVMTTGALPHHGEDSFQEDARDEEESYIPVQELKGESLEIIQRWEQFYMLWSVAQDATQPLAQYFNLTRSHLGATSNQSHTNIHAMDMWNDRMRASMKQLNATLATTHPEPIKKRSNDISHTLPSITTSLCRGVKLTATWKLQITLPTRTK